MHQNFFFNIPSIPQSWDIKKTNFFSFSKFKTLKPNEHACMNIIYIIICLYEQVIMFHITNIMYNVYLQ